MRPAQRWPLHPAPAEGEALSSWLHRVAGCYRMDVRDLLEHDLGHGQLDHLDTAPPLPLLRVLAQRSGIEVDRLRGMSLAGWTPWLLDSLDDAVPSALETYVFQGSVLLPKRSRQVRSMAHWRAWLPRQPLRRACPLCLRGVEDKPLRLMWQLPLLLSCPTHGCWLEPYWSTPWQFMGWDNASGEPRPASAPISAMDRLTGQALTAGYVELPRRRIHAGLWFRLLRTVLDELNTPLSQCGSCGRSIRSVWECCGHPLRAGQSRWRPYEMLDPAVQLQMLEAAATAIDLIQSKRLRPRGELAELFLPEPQTGFTHGPPADERKKERLLPEPQTGFTHGPPADEGKPEPVNPWQETLQAINDALAEARHNPETARALFGLASFGRRDPASLEPLRALFAKAHIPLDFLSHYYP